MSQENDITIISEFLARRDVPDLLSNELVGQVDLIILLGSSLIDPIYLAADALKKGISQKLLISGGVGHSTHLLHEAVESHQAFADVEVDARPEADIIQDILVGTFGIEPQKIMIENRSTNCGTNAEQSYALLQAQRLSPESIVLVQDPTMQRRSHACFERAWQGERVSFTSFAPFVPSVGNGEVVGARFPSWSYERFASLVAGEIPRLRDDENGYGPKGRNYFDHVEIPVEVEQAQQRIVESNPSLLRDMPK